MAFILRNLNIGVRTLEDKLKSLSISCVNVNQERFKYPPRPRLRNPTWFLAKEKKSYETNISPENKEFLNEVIQDRYELSATTPINSEIFTSTESTTSTKTATQRTGLIARKIGIYPMWSKNGKKYTATLLQILDNHVIKYTPPELTSQQTEGNDSRKPTTITSYQTRVYNRKACVLMGAESADPTKLTREYCGLFKNSGVIPKKFLMRFFVSPNTEVQSYVPGNVFNASHYSVGDYVDVRGKTIDRGFQGVMKRHGFHGMPASHGVTKTHRRPGNIGGGGEKGRVWPGKKMPGHMGNRYRRLVGLKILRINTKYNVIYVRGQNIPGETNSIVTVFDTKLRKKRRKEDRSDLESDSSNVSSRENEANHDRFDEEVHPFSAPSIRF